VIKGKVEDVELPEKADILISEPMGKFMFYFLPANLKIMMIFNVYFIYNCQICSGDLSCSMACWNFTLFFVGTFFCYAGTLLVNERMLESYVIARDRFLVPTGKMFPALGR